MTTTTSSSRNPIKGERLFDRTFARLLAATLRQNGLTMGIYGVCLILVTVCPAFLEAKNYVEGSYLDAPRAARQLLVLRGFGPGCPSAAGGDALSLSAQPAVG